MLNLNQGWVQTGADIIGGGTGSSGWFGAEVSISSDGGILAVTAKQNSEVDYFRGKLRIFAWDGTTWTQRGADIDGESSSDRFGSSVSLSDDGSVVAAGASNGNYVKVLAWDGTNWVQRGPTLVDVGRYGYSEALSGDGGTLAVGAPELNGGAGTRSGQVRVYQWDGTNWVVKGAFINGEAADDRLGYEKGLSISSDGNVVAVGAPGNSSFRGRVRVFQFVGGAWVQRGGSIDGEAASDWSGVAVDLSSDGTVLAIGAMYNDNGASDSGHVRVYTWNGASWVQRGTNIAGQYANDNLGKSVALSNDGGIIAIGANEEFNNGTGYGTGYVVIFEWDGTTWVQKGVDILGNVAGDQFGDCVSLNSDGSIVAAGARNGYVNVLNYVPPSTAVPTAVPTTVPNYCSHCCPHCSAYCRARHHRECAQVRCKQQ